MKYKAIIFDHDGTAIPNRRDGMPSERLVKVIEKIKDKVFICAATGRALNVCQNVLKELGLVSPCIIFGGTQIVDPVSLKILWEKAISKEQVEAIMAVARNYNCKVYFSNDENWSLPQEKTVTGSENIVYIEHVTEKDREE